MRRFTVALYLAALAAEMTACARELRALRTKDATAHARELRGAAKLVAQWAQELRKEPGRDRRRHAARSRASKPALDALTALEARGSAADRSTVRIKTPRALADGYAQRNGHRLSDLTAGELAALLRRPLKPGPAPTGRRGRQATIYLTPDVEVAAKRIGGGNLSAGIARAVLEYRPAAK